MQIFEIIFFISSRYETEGMCAKKYSHHREMNTRKSAIFFLQRPIFLASTSTVEYTLEFDGIFVNSKRLGGVFAHKAPPTPTPCPGAPSHHSRCMTRSFPLSYWSPGRHIHAEPHDNSSLYRCPS